MTPGSLFGIRVFRFATIANPIQSREEIEDLRATLPADVFAQEYEGAFIEIEGAVFMRKFLVPTVARLREAEPGEPCFVGVDIAKSQDYTVLTAMSGRKNSEGRRPIIGFERFRRLEYTIQIVGVVLG